MTIYLCLIKVRSDGKTIEAGNFGDCDYESKFHLYIIMFKLLKLNSFTIVDVC